MTEVKKKTKRRRPRINNSKRKTMTRRRHQGGAEHHWSMAQFVWEVISNNWPRTPANSHKKKKNKAIDSK
tara:strand:- start:539 stop:748 length:210 start_codon:yes stop_codon:yes gene_type:complete